MSVQPMTEKAPDLLPAIRPRREKAEPERDWFSDEVPGARAFQPAPATPPKSASGRRPSARTGGAKSKTPRG